MTRTQEVAMIEAAVKAGRVKKCPYMGDAISLVPYVKPQGGGKGKNGAQA